MKINQKSFFPQPKVNSVIVQIKPKKHENLKFSKSNLEKITHILFHQRRKKIKSSIKSFGNPELICKLAKIDSSMRPEQITPEGFARLSIILNSKLN